MERKIYQPTEKQLKNWGAIEHLPTPTDDEFKQTWATKHHGKTAGWGLGKREWIIGSLSNTHEYQMGLWQARVDFVQGLDYQGEAITDENMNAYKLGYYRGWNNGGALHGIDGNTIDRLTIEYGG